MEIIANLLDGLNDSFAAEFLLSPLYIGSTLLIVWTIWIARGKPTGFLRFIAPKELYVHPSTMVDIKIAAFNTFFTATGALSLLWVAPTITLWLLDRFVSMTGGPMVIPETGVWQGALAAVLLFLTQDLCRYWNHYLHHMIRVLWPFHAVHHSAEVLTPLTFLRAHPAYYALQVLLMSVMIGCVQAVILFAVVGQIEPWVLYAGTIVFNAYIFFAGHLRHSHIWLSYGRTLEHILISPAQHQVHHSSARIHHDKNFGEVFAFWDWMFGTLYVPDGPEDLTFGIAGRDGERIAQPHPTLKDALIGPFAEVWEEISKGTSLDPNKKPKAR